MKIASDPNMINSIELLVDAYKGATSGPSVQATQAAITLCDWFQADYGFNPRGYLFKWVEGVYEIPE